MTPTIRKQLDEVGKLLLAGERIDAQQALLLLEHEQLTTLGALADLARRRKHDDNVELSGKRAESVKAYLVEHGVAADRIETQGMGPDEPIAKNNTPGGRAKNRRIELKLTER